MALGQGIAEKYFVYHCRVQLLYDLDSFIFRLSKSLADATRSIEKYTDEDERNKTTLESYSDQVQVGSAKK